METLYVIVDYGFLIGGWAVLICGVLVVMALGCLFADFVATMIMRTFYVYETVVTYIMRREEFDEWRAGAKFRSPLKSSRRPPVDPEFVRPTDDTRVCMSPTCLDDSDHAEH